MRMQKMSVQVDFPLIMQPEFHFVGLLRLVVHELRFRVHGYVPDARCELGNGMEGSEYFTPVGIPSASPRL